MEREMHICSFLDHSEQMWKVKKRAIKIVFFINNILADKLLC